MIKEEKDPKYDTKWQGDTNPFTIKLPKPDKPRPTTSCLEGTSHRESGWLCMVKTTPVCHGWCSYQGNWHAIVCEKTTDMAMEIGFAGERLKEEGCDEHQKGEYDSNKWTGNIRWVVGLKPAGDDLDAILQVNPRYIEAKDVTRKKGDVF